MGDKLGPNGLAMLAGHSDLAALGAVLERRGKQDAPRSPRCPLNLRILRPDNQASCCLTIKEGTLTTRSISK